MTGSVVTQSMSRALELARRGPVGPNPRVGAVVLDDQGQAQTRYWGLLIERSKIDVLEFQAFPPQPEESSP